MDNGSKFVCVFAGAAMILAWSGDLRDAVVRWKNRRRVARLRAIFTNAGQFESLPTVDALESALRREGKL